MLACSNLLLTCGIDRAYIHSFIHSFQISDQSDVVNQIWQTHVPHRSNSLSQMTFMHQSIKSSLSQIWKHGVRLSMKHGVIKRRHELYFEKKYCFLFLRLVISAITKRARSSRFWGCCYGNSGEIGQKHKYSGIKIITTTFHHHQTTM